MKDLWTTRVEQAKENPEEAKKLRNDLMLIIYQFRTGNRYEDDQADFLIYFLPRMERILANFKDTGVPFMVFFRKCLLWEFISYMRSKGQRENFERNWNLELPDADLQPAVSKSLDKNKSIVKKELPCFVVNKENPECQNRRFFLFLLKMSEYLPEGAIERFCVTTGYDPDYVYDSLIKLKDMTRFRIARLQKLRELRDSHHYEWMIRERSAYGESCPEKKYLTRRRATEYKRRRDRLNRMIAQIRCFPQHKDIAVLTGLPKGTVDSGIHLFHRKVQALSDADAS